MRTLSKQPETWALFLPDVLCYSSAQGVKCHSGCAMRCGALVHQPSSASSSARFLASAVKANNSSSVCRQGEKKQVLQGWAKEREGVHGHT